MTPPSSTREPSLSLFGQLPTGFTPATLTKVLSTVALRMPYVFLATLARGLHTTVAHLGALFGLAELAGLAVFLIGRSIDRGTYRFWLLTGMASNTSGLILMAVAGNPTVFTAGFAGVTLGVAVFTATGHSWIGHEVPFDRRGETIGLFETSWAMGLLVGAPAVGLVIAATNWRVPWVFLALGYVPLAFWLHRVFPHQRTIVESHVVPEPFRVTRVVAFTIATAFLVSFGASAIFSTYGTWLADRFGLTVRAIGVLSIAIGGAELLASTSTVRFSDSWGTKRSARGGFVVMAAGALAVAVVPKVSALGIAALVLVFLGFEFGFICVLSIVTEVGRHNRGTVVAVNGALLTVARAASAALGTALYAGHGMPAAAGVTVGCCVVAVVCLSATSQPATSTPATSTPTTSTPATSATAPSGTRPRNPA